MGAVKADGVAVIVMTQENALKKTSDERFAVPLNFNFFKYPVHSYGLKDMMQYFANLIQQQ